MQIRKFFSDLQTDIVKITSPIRTEAQRPHEQRVKSVALRIIGLALAVGGALSFAAAAFSIMTFSPIIAVGWATIGVAALVFGHDLIKVATNILKAIESLRLLEEIRTDVIINREAAMADFVHLEDEAFDAALAQLETACQQAEVLAVDAAQERVRLHAASQKSTLEGTWVFKFVNDRFRKLKHDVNAFQAHRAAQG